MRLSLLAATAAILPAAAHAQSLEIYDFPNFQGDSLSLSQPVDNLSFRGFDDRATSLAVRSGQWEICTEPGFRGECQTVGDNVWDLQTLGLNNQISSIRPVTGGATPAPTPAPAPPPATPAPPYSGGYEQLVLYDRINYRGEALTLDQQTDLRFSGFDDRARSVTVDGEWLICDGPNLTGRCEWIESDIADLTQIGFSNGVSSAAPSSADAGPIYDDDPYYGGGQTAQMLEGDRAGFYPFPDITARRLTGCLNGDRRSCEAEVDRFCQSQTLRWREGAYYTVDARAGQLNDILCVR